MQFHDCLIFAWFHKLVAQMSLGQNSLTLLKEITNETQWDSLHCRSLEAELHSLREDQMMYQDNIEVKDNIVMTMTSRIAELEQALDQQPASHGTATNTAMARNNDTPELYKLKASFEVKVS